MRKVASVNTRIVAPSGSKGEIARAKLGANVSNVKPGDKLQIDEIQIEAVPAYNLNKFKEPGKVFHPKEEQKVGFIIQVGSVRIYHAGDTDSIPEMTGIETDIALLPVSGTYVMTADEAAEAAGRIRLKLAIPMHYGTIVGSEKDALRFKELARCDVQILRPE